MSTDIINLIRADRPRFGVEQWFQIDYTDEDFFSAEEFDHAKEPQAAA